MENIFQLNITFRCALDVPISASAVALCISPTARFMIFLSGAVLPVSAPSVLNRLKAISLKLLYVPAFFFFVKLSTMSAL